MFVAVCRNCIGGAGKFDLVCALGHYLVTGFDARKDLHLFAVVGSESDGLFFVSFFIYLQIDEEAALFFGQGCVGKCNNILHGGGEQEYFYKRAGDEFSFIVKFK